VLDRIQLWHVQVASRSHNGVLIMAHRQYLWSLTLPFHWLGIPSRLIQTLWWPFGALPRAWGGGGLLQKDATIPADELDGASARHVEEVYQLVLKRERNVVACSSIQCPGCQSMNCWRSKRHGGIDLLHRLVGQFPWRCRVCGTRFYLRNRSR